MKKDIVFNFTFTYYLSAAGREISLLNGGDGKHQQKITGVITLEQAKKTGRVINEQGYITDPYFDWVCGFATLKYKSTNPLDESPWKSAAREWDAPQTFSVLWAEYEKLLAERGRIIEAAKKDRQVAADNFLADKSARAEFNSYNRAVFLPGKKYTHTFGDATTEFLTAVERKAADNAAKKLRLEKEQAEKEAYQQQLQEEKNTQIKNWVEQNGTANQKERFAAGCFPIQEAVAEIKKAAFSKLESFPLFERITNSDVQGECSGQCRCHYGDLCEIDCSTEDGAPATAEQWETIKKMQQALPEAQFTLRKHQCFCIDPDCEASVSRKSIYAKRTIGAFVFSRNFAA